MKPRFSRNINPKGRLVRGIIALLLIVGAGFGFSAAPCLGFVLAVSGAFVLFEALRGWCALRACGIKTRL